MVVPVLIVTSAPGIGEVVRRTLVESGRYEAVLSTNALQGIRQARAFPFAAAILDVDLDKDLTGVSLRKLGLSLREIIPGIPLVVLSASSDPYDTEIKPLAPEGIITTPLYPSNILRTVDRVVGMEAPSFAPQAAPAPDAAAPGDHRSSQVGPPAWLHDVTRAAQHLTRLSLETASQAALIVSEDRLWAYAGELPQLAAQELADTVVHYWASNGESDLARFVHLDSDGGEYMLYATSLGSGMVLALVYGVETPFSKIRSQVVNLARLLSSPPVRDSGTAAIKGSVHYDPSEITKEGAPAVIEEGPLFGDVPSPNPEMEQGAPITTSPMKMRKEDRISEYSDLLPHSFEAAHKQPTGGAAVTAGSSDTPSASPTPGVAISELENWELNPTSSGAYSLIYGMLLIPRLPGHHLVGDLAERLPVWVSQLCVAFACRLEHISLRPDYLQWNASAAPEIPSAQLVRIIRKHTSQRIFDEFPVLSRENPSGDFWAAGFLLVTGSQPPPGELVQNFIRQTRYRQGIFKPVTQSTR